MRVFEFGRRIHFHGGLIEELYGLFGVTAQIALVPLMRFADLPASFQNVLLCLGQGGVQGRIDMGTLRDGRSRESQAHGEPGPSKRFYSSLIWFSLDSKREGGRTAFPVNRLWVGY